MPPPVRPQSFPLEEVDPPRDSKFLRDLAGVYRELYYAVLSIVGNRTDADDIMQEVCIVLWQRFEEFEPGTNFRKWATAFAFNIAKANARQIRRRRGVGLSDEALAKLSRLQAANSELFDLRRENLQKCLKKLSPRDYRFLLECYGRETTLAELASRKAVPVRTIYSRLMRLRKRLIDCVQRSLK